MFFLILLWLLIGLFLGLLTLGAQLYPTLKRAWLVLPGLGMFTALGAGFLGLLLFGKDGATAFTCWLPILALVLLPRFFVSGRTHTSSGKL